MKNHRARKWACPYVGLAKNHVGLAKNHKYGCGPEACAEKKPYLLPTKDIILNRQVNEVNSLFQQLSGKHPDIIFLSYPGQVFATNTGLLRPDMGRYDTRKKCTLDSDLVHLGVNGLRALRWYIKAHIVRPRNSTDRFKLHQGSFSAAATSSLHNRTSSFTS